MQRFVSGFDRPNLTYRVLGVKGQATKFKVLGEILDAQEEGSSIIYAATRRARRRSPVSCTNAVRRRSSTTPDYAMLNDSVPRTRLWRASAV